MIFQYSLMVVKLLQTLKSVEKDGYASGESVESAEPVTSESEVVGEPIEIEDSLESSTDSSEGFDDSVESIEIESEE